jgi:hypothetical protein
MPIPSKPDSEEIRKDSSDRPPRKRRVYSPPRLEVLGDIRDLTLGPSPGVGDSINPGNRKP